VKYIPYLQFHLCSENAAEIESIFPRREEVVQILKQHPVKHRNSGLLGNTFFNFPSAHYGKIQIFFLKATVESVPVSLPLVENILLIRSERLISTWKEEFEDLIDMYLCILLICEH
jgi:hypothetical protein